MNGVSASAALEEAGRSVTIQTTTSLALGAYVHMRSLREPRLCIELVKASRPNGRDFLFTFRTTQDVWDMVRLDHINSESYAYDQSVAALKSYLFPSTGRRNGHSRTP